MTGHVSGMPVEELVPALMSGSGAALILLVAAAVRRRTPK